VGNFRLGLMYASAYLRTAMSVRDTRQYAVRLYVVTKHMMNCELEAFGRKMSSSNPVICLVGLKISQMRFETRTSPI
jgi:hypothetical protein